MARHQDPAWWKGEQTSTWERVKEALARDWEQTKADFSNEYGHDLNQGVTDTVKQALGAEPIPPSGTRNPLTGPAAAVDTLRSPGNADWENAEPAIRYGYGASSYYETHDQWDDKVEAKLREEWNDLKSGRTWDEVKSQVRYGWERARRKVGGTDN